jgi:hypothetical protein
MLYHMRVSVVVSLPKTKNPSHQHANLTGASWRLAPALFLLAGDVAVRYGVVGS